MNSTTKYRSTKDRDFLDQVQLWFREQPEILALFRYPYAAGSRSFEFFRSFQQFEARLRELPERTSVIIFREPQLPIRGIVDDQFIDQCISALPNGAEFLLVETRETTAGKHSWFHHGAGESHAELRDELNESRGVPVAVGLYPPWLKDSDNVISAIVPDSDGNVVCAAY